MGGQFEKSIKRLLSIPKNYTYSEAKTLLRHLGYEESNKGSTSGSRVLFYKNERRIALHKPHPGDIMKVYVVKELIKFLKDGGEI